LCQRHARVRYGIALTEAPIETTPFRPRWAIVGVIAGLTVLIIIVVVIIVKVAVNSTLVPLGVTSANELQTGSCLAEGATDLAEYTVVDCGLPHPQQVVALIDLGKTDNIYTQFSAMSSYAQEICDRLIEYRLYLREGPTYDDYQLVVVGMPSEQQFADGGQFARCAIIHTAGDELTESYYKAMP
jgi:hypothetical protein